MYSASGKQADRRQPPSRAPRLRVGRDASFLTRLSIVFAEPIRLIIVRELYMREMSPPQFFEQFGGGSVDKVRWHFKKLAEHGWLRKVRTGSPPGVLGPPQHFYRATELALIDTETWIDLPLSIRAAYSARTVDQLWDQVGRALRARTIDSRADRHLTWVPVVLDEEGWKERGKALAHCFRALQHEQDDAKVRLQVSGEEPILMTVALAGFESPGALAAPSPQGAGSAGLPALAQPPRRFDPSVPLTMRIAKVFADPLNVKIITELNLASLSATQLQARIGGAPVYAFDRRCKMLLELGWIVKTDTKTGGRRRGATEIFYRAAGPVYLDTGLWSGISEEVRRSATWTTLQQFKEKVDEAVRAETFDQRVDRHLTWLPLLVDETGWEQVIALLEGFFRSIFPAQEAAKQRLAAAGEKGFLATYFVAGFESAGFPSP